MPAYYLSRLPATTNDPVIAAFDPFQTDLAELQREEPFAQNMLYFGKHNRWPSHLSKSEANVSRRPSQKDVSQQRKHFVGAFDRLQISQNSIPTSYPYYPPTPTPTSKASEGGSLRSPQQHLRWTRRHSEDIHENFLFLLLARPLPGYQDARPNLSHMPAKKKSHNQANSTTAITNTRKTKLEDPCRLIRADVDS